MSHHTQILCQVSAKSADNNFWALEDFLKQWHVNLNKTQFINTFYNKKNFFVIAIHNSSLVFPQVSSYQPRVYQLSLSLEYIAQLRKHIDK